MSFYIFEILNIPFYLSFIILKVGYDMTKKAADDLYRKTGVHPSQIDVVELHDCFAANELITYEALGLCPPGNYYYRHPTHLRLVPCIHGS